MSDSKEEMRLLTTIVIAVLLFFAFLVVMS